MNMCKALYAVICEGAINHSDMKPVFLKSKLVASPSQASCGLVGRTQSNIPGLERSNVRYYETLLQTDHSAKGNSNTLKNNYCKN